jgi:hypothetical protein
MHLIHTWRQSNKGNFLVVILHQVCCISILPGFAHKISNTIIYSCLCGSLLESVQEGKGEIIYQFRQHGVCLQC